MPALLIGLLAAVVALTVSAAVTARRPVLALPDAAGYLDGWAASHDGYDPRGNRLVTGWLTGVYRLGRPLAAAGVPPSVVTLAGPVVAYAALVTAAAGGRWPLLGAVAVAASGVLDNLDGCVAVLTGRATRFGYVLDSVVDRVADVLYLVAVWLLGAPVWTCVAAGAGLGLLEYTRARAGNAGLGEVGVVTVGERPTRVVLTAVTLLAAGAYADHAGPAATAGALATLAVAAAGELQLLVAVRRLLR